jgi:hypothetical protein
VVVVGSDKKSPKTIKLIAEGFTPNYSTELHVPIYRVASFTNFIQFSGLR